MNRHDLDAMFQDLLLSKEDARKAGGIGAAVAIITSTYGREEPPPVNAMLAEFVDVNLIVDKGDLLNESVGDANEPVLQVTELPKRRVTFSDRRDKVLAKSSVFIGTFIGKMALGTAVAMAATGGAHAAGVVDVPIFGRADANVEQHVDIEADAGAGAEVDPSTGAEADAGADAEAQADATADVNVETDPQAAVVAVNEAGVTAGATVEATTDTAGSTVEAARVTAGATVEATTDTARDTVAEVRDTARDTVAEVRDTARDTVAEVRDTARNTVTEVRDTADDTVTDVVTGGQAAVDVITDAVTVPGVSAGASGQGSAEAGGADVGIGANGLVDSDGAVVGIDVGATISGLGNGLLGG